MQRPKILILTVPHGAGHERVANALEKALLEMQPDLKVEVVNALEHCADWFRVYYDSYKIPLKCWPALWGWIESIQHNAKSTGPAWLYRKGAKSLFRFIAASRPDIVVATEVGACELAAMHKRETKTGYYLVGVPAGAEDTDRAWAQAEVNLYPIMPGDIAAQLESTGVPAAKILPCGIPVDPAFAHLPDLSSARKRLEVRGDLPLLLVLFGGTGFGRPHRIVPELRKVKQPFQAVFITGRNPRLENETRRLCSHHPHFRVLGWVDNMHEWMAAADLLLSKPGPTTVAEAIDCGLPLLAFDPLPGGERRVCRWIEKWDVGHWMRHLDDLGRTLERLLAGREELQLLRDHALKLARPRAAYDAVEAILRLWRA